MELLLKHVFYYLPLWVSFLVLYLKVIDLFYAFEWKIVGDIISRVLYVAFFGYVAFNIDIQNDTWFGLVAIGTIMLFSDEVIGRIFRKKRRQALLENCIKEILKELDTVSWGET